MAVLTTVVGPVPILQDVCKFSLTAVMQCAEAQRVGEILEDHSWRGILFQFILITWMRDHVFVTIYL